MDYYIRSWDPDSTYPPNPQEGDVAYTITLDQSWSPVAGVKNDNLLKEEVYENGEWKEIGGGTQGDDDMKIYELDDSIAIPNGSDVIADIEAGIWPVLMYNNKGTRMFWFTLTASGSDTQILTRKVVEIIEDADYTNVPVVDLSDKFDTKPTKAALLAAAEKYIEDNDLGELEVSLDVSFVDLASIDEYAGRARDLKIDLCDTVTIVFPMYGVETQAKIVRIETNVLLERYELITVGTEQTTVADTIASLQNQTQQLAVNNAGGGGGGGSDVLALSISGNVISLSQNGSVVSSITLPVYSGGVS